MVEDNVKAQMRKGILDYCILAILSQGLTYRWEESPQGPPRKYYSLTDKGREYLASLDEAWEELVGQIQMIRHRENDPA